MKAASRKGSRWADSVEWLLLRGATSLKDCCRVDGAISSLTHSGKITALNNSCTDTPLSLASADTIWYDSSRMDNMNLAMADDLRPFPWESCAYITIYTLSHGRRYPRFDRLENFQRSTSSVRSEGLVENRVAVETDQSLQMFRIV